MYGKGNGIPDFLEQAIGRGDPTNPKLGTKLNPVCPCPLGVEGRLEGIGAYFYDHITYI
jgi:hypothetical protein